MKTATKTTGLRYWMARVLEECDHIAADFSADPVHDLRVALRRCRSMADGMMAMDPDPGWKAMKKAGKRLFQRLGDLRDVQIMMEWIDKLHPASVAGAPSHASLQAEGTPAQTATPDAEQAVNPNDYPQPVRDPAAQALLEILKHREGQQKHEARAALEEFDRKQWRQWSKSLPLRAARVRPGSAVFKHLALERWTAARDLHNRATRNRSQVAFHTLRIGIKRFRYIVENFLPAEHKAWSNDLKHMQDLLGEVHDLDVLWATALSCHVFPDVAEHDDSRKAWHARIVEERTKRLEEYRQKMVGPGSLWNAWRAGLPQGKQIQEVATRRMKLWAKALDPDFAHSERVARLALELYDGLEAAGLLTFNGNGLNGDGLSGKGSKGKGSDGRDTLYVAALLHDVGRSKEKKGHHKASLELIRAHGTPLGWKAENMQRAAVVARFHAGALPTRSHKALRDLLPDEQKAVIRLVAILRLANAMDAAHDGHIRRVQIENADAGKRRTNGFLRKPARLGKNEALIISAEGYTPGSPTAQTIAAERYLLETVLRRPVVVKAASGLRRPASGIRTGSAA
ncbi:MAG TPA: CHAD domain-containing protein [Candidatus Sulfotelmatobacter sp.]|nr:CHAD domain-containing protein [Candidatus Sulfotelmatobacter sp.]